MVPVLVGPETGGHMANLHVGGQAGRDGQRPPKTGLLGTAAPPRWSLLCPQGGSGAGGGRPGLGFPSSDGGSAVGWGQGKVGKRHRQTLIQPALVWASAPVSKAAPPPSPSGHTRGGRGASRPTSGRPSPGAPAGATTGWALGGGAQLGRVASMGSRTRAVCC